MTNRVYIIFFIISFSLSGFAQDVIPYISVDQFGYTLKSKKVAIIRDPQIGYDAEKSFVPGDIYQVINTKSKAVMFTGKPKIWNNGLTDSSSGDKCWWFDFSLISTPGKYYILDKTNNVRSFEFTIADNVYKDVLKQSVRTFYYQRCGIAKALPYADTGWVDGICHNGKLQDRVCAPYNHPEDLSKALDLSGGWHDAGDYNKYTNFAWGVLIDLLTAYQEKPYIWTDDYNIPESKNGIPDILDEIKWELDWLLKMQQPDGSVLSIVGEASGTPPSAATAQSLYGPATTSATLSTAGVFALAANVFYGSKNIKLKSYADTLKIRAIKAWQWADKNRQIIFLNNKDGAPFFSKGLGAGQQELDDYGRSIRKLAAAAFLFSITKDTVYKNYYEKNYNKTHLFNWDDTSPFEVHEYIIQLYYAKLIGITPAVATDIKNAYSKLILSEKHQTGFLSDPYMAYIKEYVWGSNMHKCHQGNMYYQCFLSGIKIVNFDVVKASQGYINYIHGVNPLQKVYLTNMSKFGAENSSSELYHMWFTDHNEFWDQAGVSKFGPIPGILVGGANAQYKPDNCCSDGSRCFNEENYARCLGDITPPYKQPKQKSYKDFNDGWPLNSWEITENGIYYQAAYIKLLSKFVSN